MANDDDNRGKHLASVLKKLRTHDGLTAERLSSTSIEFDNLKGLPVVRQSAQRPDDVPNAVVRVVRGCALSMDDLVARAIVDAALRLRLLDELPDEAKNLYAADLTDRRAALIAGWNVLMAGEPDAGDPPKMGHLRTGLEDDALLQLADLLLEERSTPVVASGNDVVVVGAAVMDFVFRIAQMPAPDTSVQADRYVRQPGGKGLTQAVAAARLGLSVRLATVVGDDQFGEEIIKYLEDEHVGVELINKRQGSTPVTCVITYRDGTSLAIGWKNDREVKLSEAEAKAAVGGTGPDGFVFLTFEPSLDVVKAALTALPTKADKRPTVLVTPAPPVEFRDLPPALLGRIDYLVANEWELRKLLPGDEDSPASELVNQLHSAGVRTVCLCQRLGASVYTSETEFEVPPLTTPVHEDAGARDAFCAALASRLKARGTKVADRDDVAWSVAAMATSAMESGISHSMPTTDEVDDLMNRRSQLHVYPTIDQQFQGGDQ